MAGQGRRHIAAVRRRQGAGADVGDRRQRYGLIDAGAQCVRPDMVVVAALAGAGAADGERVGQAAGCGRGTETIDAALGGIRKVAVFVEADADPAAGETGAAARRRAVADASADAVLAFLRVPQRSAEGAGHRRDRGIGKGQDQAVGAGAAVSQQVELGHHLVAGAGEQALQVHRGGPVAGGIGQAQTVADDLGVERGADALGAAPVPGFEQGAAVEIVGEAQ